MSYARWGEDGSDVYVFGTHDGTQTLLVCMHCKLFARDAVLTGRESFTARFAGDMLAHLERHRAAGHTVPQRAFDRLKDE